MKWRANTEQRRWGVHVGQKEAKKGNEKERKTGKGKEKRKKEKRKEHKKNTKRWVTVYELAVAPAASSSSSSPSSSGAVADEAKLLVRPVSEALRVCPVGTECGIDFGSGMPTPTAPFPSAFCLAISWSPESK